MAGIAAMAGVLAAAAESNPYSVIPGRNVFGLNGAPALEKLEAPQPDLPEVKLGGFVETAGQWKVFLAVKTKGGDAKAAGSTLYLTLGEGDQGGGVEVVKVDASQEKADIVNAGAPMTLSMKENGFASQPVAAPAPRAGRPSVQTMPNVPPTALASIAEFVARPAEAGNPGNGGVLVGGAPGPGGGPSWNRGAGNSGSATTGGAARGADNQNPQPAVIASNSSFAGGGNNSNEGSDSDAQGGGTATLASRDPFVLNMGYANASHRAPVGGGDSGLVPVTQ
jgi:hypothetical protein